MVGITAEGMFLRFLLGGLAVVGSYIFSRNVGGKIGGIFAAFPAVYLAALLTIRLDYTGDQLIEKSVSLSKGALIGMVANVICSIAAGYLCVKKGWKLGLTLSVIIWFFTSFIMVYFLNKTY